MKSIIITASFCFITISSVCANILLEKPTPITLNQVEELQHQWRASFNWAFGRISNFEVCSFNCNYEQQKAGCALLLLGIPVRSCNFNYRSYLKEIIEYYRSSFNYYFQRPIQFNTNNATIISYQELRRLLSNKKYLFYTGAGISAASQVPTMRELEKSLHMESPKLFFKELMLNPRSIAESFSIFCKQAMQALPTAAHAALHTIAQTKGCAIITENVDLLQHKAGSVPLHTHDVQLRSAKTDDLKDVDIVVTVGLRHDDCGFLAWYKKHNPNGIIVAIDLNMPTYLSKDDFLVKGDIQEIIPQLATDMLK